jgi:hypothetical protein
MEYHVAAMSHVMEGGHVPVLANPLAVALAMAMAMALALVGVGSQLRSCDFHKYK